MPLSAGSYLCGMEWSAAPDGLPMHWRLEPTKAAIETLLPRMPKGAVIAFDELNQRMWPGETMAVLETVGIRGLRLERTPMVPQISFAVLE